MEARLGRPERDAEHARRLGQGQLEVVVEDDERPVLGREMGKDPIDLVAIRDRLGFVGCWGVKDGVDLDLDGSPTPDPRLIDAGSDDEAMEPGVEPVGVAKSRQVPPGPDQRLLDRVPRELAVPKDQPGSRVEPRDCAGGELSEGVMIAPPGSLDELSLLHGCSRRKATLRSRSKGYGGGVRPNRSIVHGSSRNRGPAGTIGRKP